MTFVRSLATLADGREDTASVVITQYIDISVDVVGCNSVKKFVFPK